MLSTEVNIRLSFRPASSSSELLLDNIKISNWGKSKDGAFS